MIKKEFKNNLKSFIIWSSVLIVMFILVFAIYPFILTDETVESLDESISTRIIKNIQYGYYIY